MKKALKTINIGDARGFLEREVAGRYNSSIGFPGVEAYGRRYRGRFNLVLKAALDYLYERNNGSSSRIFSIGESEIEEILGTINLGSS